MILKDLSCFNRNAELSFMLGTPCPILCHVSIELVTFDESHLFFSDAHSSHESVHFLDLVSLLSDSLPIVTNGEHGKLNSIAMGQRPNIEV
jgi:hypothetical protein